MTRIYRDRHLTKDEAEYYNKIRQLEDVDAKPKNKGGRPAGFESEQRKFDRPTKVVRVPENWDVQAIYESLELMETCISEWEDKLAESANPDQPRLTAVKTLVEQMRDAMPRTGRSPRERD